MRNMVAFRVYQAAGFLLISSWLSMAGPTPERNPARDLLQNMQSAQSRMKNYQCVAEYTTFCDYEARRRLYESAVAEGDPADVLKRLADNIKSSGKTYELQSVVADSNGRIKLASQHAEYDLNNKRQPTIQMASAWDGKTSVTYTRLDPNRPAGAALGATRGDDFRMSRHPLWSFRGRFVEAFEKAVQAGKKVEIREEAPGGLREIRFICDDPVVARGADFPWTATVDPAKGFSVVKWGFTWPDGQDAWFYATFKEFKDGIWFPVEGKMDGHFADGVVDSVTTVKITNVVVNDPNFSDNLFHIELPPGTRVRDTVMGLQYVVGEPDSTSALGEHVTTAHIIAKGVGPNDPPTEETVFLPHMKQAREKGSPFVLNLRTRKLAGVDASAATQEVLNSLYGATVGDLFWDGGIVVVGDTKIEVVLGERTKSLPRRKMEHGARYRLPERVQLPCVLQVTDRTKSRYRMVVKEVSEKGISISYKPLPDR